MAPLCSEYRQAVLGFQNSLTEDYDHLLYDNDANLPNKVTRTRKI